MSESVGDVSDHINLTALGHIYGVNASDAGRWLKGVGLREPDGRPSRKAVSEGFVREEASGFGSHWLWQREMTCEVLDGMGQRRGGRRGGAEQYDGFVLICGA